MGRDRASRPAEKALRMFVAADVPDAVRSRLGEEFQPLRKSHPELRWAPRENWHVTLKFLGAVWPRLVEDVRSAVASVAGEIAPFDTCLLGPDAFPSSRRARVIWVGMSDPDERFPLLAARLDTALGPIVKPEERPFTPHLTVARAKQPVPLSDDLAAVAVMRSETFPVDHVTLYRSHLRRPAPLYEPVAIFRLHGILGGR
jgi:2'-5' RNA ligase